MCPPELCKEMTMKKQEAKKIKFIFYGDLLGVSNLYSIDTDVAKEVLNKFYNRIFENFRNMAKSNEAKVYLFSDSVVINGKDLEKIIKILEKTYYQLFYDNIFLRGAIVEGQLDFDPRIELKNVEKRLPSTDVLFRAITLEKSARGARLLIEKKLAKKILPKEWLTEDRYKKNIMFKEVTEDDFRRKIVLSNEWQAYEYLWPCTFKFMAHGIIAFLRRILHSPTKEIAERRMFVPSSVRVHLDETLGIFKRASHRYTITHEAFERKQAQNI